jgi:hypothetical protein
MPAVSLKQFRFMKGVASGSITPPKGLSRAEAAEYVSGQSPKGLPERATGRRLQRERQMRKRKA